MLHGPFTIEIDSSSCTSMLEGAVYFKKYGWADCWRYTDLRFDSGRIYGLIGEYQQGCMYLSYLLGGKINFGELRIYLNGAEIRRKDLERNSWNLEPSKEFYRNAPVGKSIEKALKRNRGNESLSDLQEKFILTSERLDRKLFQLSGERWRASAALGCAEGRTIFYAPYESSEFYYQMCQRGLLKALRELTGRGAIVLLPAGSDDFIGHIADECIYLRHEYNIDALKKLYQDMFHKSEWIF